MARPRNAAPIATTASSAASGIAPPDALAAHLPRLAVLYDERTIAALFLAIALLFNLWFLRPVVTHRVPELNDNVFHMVNLERSADALRSGEDPTDAWLPSIGMGYPVFHYYQHLPYLVPSTISTVTGLDLKDVFYWTNYLLLSLFPLSVFWSMRRFGFPQVTAGATALIASMLATNGLFGFDYGSYVWSGYGLYTQLWGMFFLPLALAHCYHAMTEGKGYLWAVLLLSATALLHLVFGYIALGSLCIFALLVPRRDEILRRFGRLALIGGFFALATSYFLVPLLKDSAYLNRSVWDPSYKYDSFGAGKVLDMLFSGDLFDYHRFASMTILAFAGLVLCLLRYRQPLYRVPAVFAVLWLLLYFGRPTWGFVLNLTPLSRDLYLHRLIAGVHLGGIFLAGIALAAPWAWALRRADLRYLVVPAAVTLLLLYPIFKDRIDYLHRNDSYMNRTEAAFAAEQPDIDGLLTTLEGLPPGRVYAGLAAQWGKDYRVGDVPMYMLLASQGYETLRILHPWSFNGDVEVLLNEQRPEEFDLFNIKYVVAPKGRTFPEFVKPLRTFGRHQLYQVDTTGYFDLVGSDVAFTATKRSWYSGASAWLNSGQPAAKQYPALYFDGAPSDSRVTVLPVSEAPRFTSQTSFTAGPTRGRVLQEASGADRFSASLQVERPSTLVLKETYHPNWQAKLDGKPVKAHMVMPSYLGIDVPAGNHAVEFHYRPQPLRHVLMGIGLLSLLGLAVVERRPRFISSLGVRLSADRRFARGWAVLSRWRTKLLEAGGGLIAARHTDPAGDFVLQTGLRAAGVDPIATLFSGIGTPFRKAIDWLAEGSIVRSLALILAAALAVRVLLLPLYAYLPGDALDEYAWERWMRAIHEHGVLNVFRASRTELLAYNWFLALISAIYGMFDGVYVEYRPHPGQYAAFPFGLHILMKMPPLAFDLALIIGVYFTTSILARHSQRVDASLLRSLPDDQEMIQNSLSASEVKRLGLIAAAVIAIHPAVLYDSAVWAQIDAAVAVAVVLSLVLVSRGFIGWGWLAWTIGFLIKPHPIIILPILVVVTYRKAGVKGLVLGASVSLIAGAAMLGPWISHGDLSRMVTIYRANFGAKLYQSVLSADAWNLWWFKQVASGHPLPGDAIISRVPLVTYKLVGLGLALGAAGLAASYVFLRPNLKTALIAAAYLAFAFYMLPTSTHERYLYPFLALLLPVAVTDRRWLWLYVPVSLTFFFNLFLVAPPIHAWSGRWQESGFSVVVAGCNALLFGAFTCVLAHSLSTSLLSMFRSWKQSAFRIQGLSRFGRQGNLSRFLLALRHRPRLSVHTRVGLSLYLVLLAVYLSTASGHFYSTEQVMDYQTAQSLVENRSFAIQPVLNAIQRDGRYYAATEPGQAILSIPLYVLGRVVETVSPASINRAFSGPNLGPWGGTVPIFFVSLFNQLLTPLLCVVVYLFCLRLGFSVRTAFFTGLIYGLGTMAWPGAHEYFEHPLEALCILSTTYVLFSNRDDLKAKHLFIAGTFLGFGILTRFNVIVVAPLLFAYVVWLLCLAAGWRLGSPVDFSVRSAAIFLRQHLAKNWLYTCRCFALFLLPQAAAILIILLLNGLRTGSWWLVHAAVSNSSSADQFSIVSLPTGLYGLLLTPGRSLFLFSPPALAGMFAFRRFWKAQTAIAILFASLALAYVLVYGSFSAWDGGLGWGNRYLEPVVPLLVIPTVYLLRDRVWAAFVVVLTVLGAGIAVLGSVINVSYAEQGRRLLDHRDYLYDPSISPIAVHLSDFIAGRNWDLWLQFVLHHHSLPFFLVAISVPLLTAIASLLIVKTSLLLDSHPVESQFLEVPPFTKGSDSVLSKTRSVREGLSGSTDSSVEGLTVRASERLTVTQIADKDTRHGRVFSFLHNHIVSRQIHKARSLPSGAPSLELRGFIDQQRFVFLIGVVTAALFAGLPLFHLRWMSGHDTLTYVPRHVEFYKVLSGGGLIPRWAPDVGAGHGEPTFNFNPPLINYAASGFHVFGFSFVASEDLAILGLLVLSGVGMYFLASEFFGSRGGLVSAVAYVFAPYLLSRLYVSHALADYAAFPFLPFAFWGLYRFCTVGRHRDLFIGAGAIALIFLSSSPAALMTFPALLFFVGVLWWRDREGAVLLRGGWVLLLGLGLAAFFWMPSLAETSYVHIARREERIDYHDHFIYLRQLIWSRWGYGLSLPGPHDGMSFAIGPVYLLSALASLAFIKKIKRASQEAAMAVAFFLIIVGLALFFTNNASLFIWNEVSALHPLQFPFRFLQLVAFGTAFLCGFPFVLLSSTKKHVSNGAMALMIGSLLVFGLPHAKPQGYTAFKEADFTPENIAAKAIPASAREFEPIDVQQFPAPVVQPTLAFSGGAGTILSSDISPTKQAFGVNVAQDSLVTSSTFYFPGWTLYVDGQKRQTSHNNPQGLMQFYLEPGRHTIELTFKNTPLRTWAERLSLFSVFLLCVSPWLPRQARTGLQSTVGVVDIERSNEIVGRPASSI